MSLELVSSIYPLNKESYRPYLRKGIYPPLDIRRINTEFLIGNERISRLQTLFTGDGSLVMSYGRQGTQYEGIIISFQQRGRDLLVLQIQGARSKTSYRLATGLNLESFITDQITKIGCFLYRSQLIDRLTFPLWTTGLESAASVNVVERYRIVTSLLGLTICREEALIVGKARDLNGDCRNPCFVCPSSQ